MPSLWVRRCQDLRETGQQGDPYGTSQFVFALRRFRAEVEELQPHKQPIVVERQVEELEELQ
jgi:hypothetical protein